MKVNKKIFILLLSGVVLVSGCGKENANKKIVENNIKQDEDNIEKEKRLEQNIENNYFQDDTSTENDYIKDNSIIENEIIDYITNPDNALDSEQNKEKLNETKEKLIKKMIILVDFIFYGTDINGITFDSLSNSAKENILNLFYKLDNVLETNYPGYKDSLEEKYSSAIDKIKDTYSSKVSEEKREEIKNIKDNATSKTKEVYENSKVKVKSWYEDLKKQY